MRFHFRLIARLLVAAAILGAAALLSSPARAEVTGKLEGVIVDRDGKGIEKAEIVFTNEKYRTRIQRGKSKKDGKFVFPFLETGNQIMQVNLPGYRVLRVQVEARAEGEAETRKEDHILGPKDPIPPIDVPSTVNLGICRVHVMVVKEEEYLDAYRALKAPAEGEKKAEAAPAQAAPAAPAEQPKDPYDAGRQLAEAGKHAEAIPLFQQALADSPENQTYLFALGRSQLESGATAEAEATLQKLIALNPAYVSAHYYLGKAQQANYRNAAAVESYRKEIEVSPDKQVNLLMHVASVQLEMAKTQPAALDQARATLEQILAAEPNNTSALSQLADIYRQKGDRAKQEETYRRLVEADPTNADVTFFNLGAIAINANRREEAAANFRKALEINPKHAEAHLQLAYCLVGMGKMAEALPHFEQYLALEPNSKRSGEVKSLISKLKG